ncbi:MAG: hydrolase [Candidatus Aenigmarchaeota archaeon]|nr:hydrolase [Candidatus Aenigmarchaeota archaeon]
MKNIGIPKREKSCLVVIDVQEKFRPVIHEFDEVVENISKLVKSFQILKVPVIVTEQNPEKLGKTVPEISEVIENNESINKMHFSCCGEKTFSDKIKASGAKDIILCGVETHVCVLKTALDLLKDDYNVYVVCDAVSSRKKFDTKIAIKRLRQSGVFLNTVESIIFQLMDSAGTDEFREIIRVVK